MSTKTTLGTPEWTEAKQKKKDEAFGFWQVRVITEHRPNFLERLFGHKPTEEVHVYICLCDHSRESVYDQDWFTDAGERLTSCAWDSYFYKLSSKLTAQVKDFLAKDKILKLHEDIINRSRA